MGTMLHHLVILLLAAIWPAFAFPRVAFNRKISSTGEDPQLHARENIMSGNIPKMEGFNITLSPKKWQPILVKSFDQQATSTLTTTLTISDHATAFTIKPSDTAVEAATFTGTTSGHTLTYMCYPTLATAGTTTKTNCIKDTVTTLGVIDIGSVAVTPNPTGFAVGSQTLTPGGAVTVGTHTLSLGSSGGLIIDGSSTHIGSPTTTRQSGTGSTTITTPTTKHTPTTKTNTTPSTTTTSTTTHKTTSKTSTKPTPTTPTTPTTSTTRTTKTTTISSRSTTTSTRPTNASTKPTTTSTKPTTTSTKRTTTSSNPTPKPSNTDEILTIGSLTVTAEPTGFQVGSTTLTPGGMITVGTQTISLETGGGDVIIGGTTVPLTTRSSTKTTSTQAWTTVSDESTTGLYGIVILPGFETLTTPTIITTKYIESSTKTTTGPIYVGTGGVVLQSWPPSTDKDHSGGGGIIIPDPIRPSISNPKLKCPAILRWLCGSEHTSSTDNGSDVDPADKPNSDPKDDPNQDDNPTTQPTTTHSSTTSKTSTTSTSTCTKTQTVSDCDVTCSPTVMSGKTTTTTTCFTTSCTTVEACSATGTTSTTIITTDPCGTGTASACPTFTDGTGWVYPDTTIDTGAVDKLASSIMSEDDSILAAFSSAFSQTGVSTTQTTLATTTRTTSSGAVTRTTTSHTAPSTSMTTTKTTKTTKTSTSTGSSTATTTSALSCVHQYNSDTDQESCYCEGHTGNYEIMSSTSGMTNYQPCAWTTLPPLYTDVNVGPITSTLSGGDVVYCTSAHWAEDGGSSKYCLGSMSTISTASHTTTSSSTTSTGVSPTGTGSPTGEMYIGIVTEGYSWTWDVYIPTVGTIPDWCDDSMGSMSADGDTTRYWYPPDIKFQDLDGKAKDYPCVYTGDKDTVGTLACEGMGEVPCTGDFPENDDAPLCTNSILYAGSAFPRVYCKWYGSDGSL